MGRPMKNLIIMIIPTFVMFFSCSQYNDVDYLIRDTIEDTIKDIKFKSDAPYTEYWQTSEETRRYGTGDCEDCVILCNDEIKEKYGIKTNIAISVKGHALLEYNGTLYECSSRYTTYPKDKYLNSVYELILFDNIDYEIKRRRF